MNKKLFIFLSLMLLVFGNGMVKAQLAGGIYTINSASPTGGTNYASFTAAIAAMGSGISGNVVFNVVPGSGPYTGQVTIGNITGASATNRIRFNGNGAIVQFTPTTTYSGALMMNGAKYVKFDSVTFKSLSTTYGFGAILYNACDYDSITRCTFDLTSVATTASANCGGIRITSTASGTSSTLSGATNTFLGNNQILGTTASGGPYYGFYFYGPNTNNVYYKNLMSNHYYYGFYDYYGNNISYIGNTLTRETKVTATGGFYGLYLYYSTAGTRVIGNRVIYQGGPTAGTSYCYPFNIFSSIGTAANPIIVSNNLVSNHTSSPYYGMRFSGSDYVKVYHNTISIDGPIASSVANYGIYSTACDYLDLKNNNITIMGGGTSTKYGLYFTSSNFISSNNNNVYVSSTQAGTQGYGYNGAAYLTLAAFQAGNPGLETNSISVNPSYAAPATGDFTPLNTALIGAGTNLLTVVPNDINEGPRSGNPTIGAFEVMPTIANNAGIATALTAPIGNFCTGSQPVRVSVNNSGTNNITSLQVNWTFNGVPQTPVPYTGTLVPVTASSGSSSAVVTLGNANLIAGVNNIKVWTSLPNGVADGNPANDTLTTTLTSATFAVTSTADTVCSSGTFILSLSPSTGYAPGALEWQSSPNGTTWTSIPGTDSVIYAGTGLTANTYFRARILNSSTNCVSPSKQIFVSNPLVLTNTPASRCGLGTLTLAATASPGATLKWYSAATGGTELGTGPSFTTPVISTTTNYYVSANVGGTQATGKLTPTSTSGNSGFSDVGLMFDAFAPFTLNSVDVYPLSTTSTSGSVTIALKNSAGTTLQTATASVIVSASGTLNTIPLNFNVTPGTNYRLVVTAATGMSTLVRELTASAINFPYVLPGISSITSAYTGGPSSIYYYYLYNWQITTGCEGLRTPVAATVTTAPAVNVTAASPTICSGNSTIVSATSTNTNYNYSWSSGNTTSSFTASPTATTTYVVNAIDPVTSCAARDSVTVTVITQVATVSPSTTQTICNGLSVTLSANTGTGFTYQWYNNGTAIPGATSATYSASLSGTYTVRVTGPTGGCNALSSGVIVNAVSAPIATVTPSGPVVVCSGDSVTLQGPAGTNYTYQWQRNGVNIVGASTGMSYMTPTAGVYRLVVSANGCSTTSGNTTISLANLPLAVISPNVPATGCDSVVLSSSSTNVTYQWNYNGSPVIGGNNATYAATVSGLYSVKVTSTVNGCSATSQSVATTVNQTPAGNITYSSPISFCEGSAVVLNTYSSANTTYQWIKDNVPVPSATTTSYVANTSGVYSLVVLNTVTGCGRTSQPVQVRVFAAPTVAIAYNAATNTLSTTQPFAQYQWNLNAQPIGGATSATYQPTQTGAFSVAVTDTNGCQTLSDIQFVNSVGVANTALGKSLKIYPNPTNGMVFVKASEKVNLVLLDFMGKKLITTDSDQPIDLKNFADGFYILNISDNTGRLIRVEKITKTAN